MTEAPPAPDAISPTPEPAPEAGRRRRALRIGVLVAVGVAVFGCLVWRPALRAIPPLLVERQTPVVAQAIVVLAGDYRARRMDHALELYRRGLLAPGGAFLVSGGPIYGELTWAQVMQDRAVAGGVPRTAIRPQDRSRTTVEDARFSLPLLLDLPKDQDGRTTILLVTSPPHSGRAAPVFRREAERLAPGRFRIVSCPHEQAAGEDDWWTDPEATRDLGPEVLKRLWPGPGS